MYYSHETFVGRVSKCVLDSNIIMPEKVYLSSYNFRLGAGMSPLTAAVHLSHFLKAKLLENMLKVFDSRTKGAQAPFFQTQKRTPIRCSFLCPGRESKLTVSVHFLDILFMLRTLKYLKKSSTPSTK